MADLSNAAKNLSVERQTDTARLIKERLTWAIKPFGFLAIMLWMLHPTTTLLTPTNPDLRAEYILAFLLGAAYSMFINWPTVKEFFIIRLDGDAVHRKNRIPQEFYVGHIEEVRAQWSKD